MVGACVSSPWFSRITQVPDWQLLPSASHSSAVAGTPYSWYATSSSTLSASWLIGRRPLRIIDTPAPARVWVCITQLESGRAL